MKLLLVICLISTFTTFQIKGNSLSKQQVIYERFNGNISQIDSFTFRYDDKVLFIINTPYELLRVFKHGILYPQIFDETNVNNTISKKGANDLDTSVIVLKYNGNRTLNSILGSDSLTISDFAEVISSQKISNIKRFKFLLFRHGFANPTEYYIELKNDKSRVDMDMINFIKGARLIRIEKGSILI